MLGVTFYQNPSKHVFVGIKDVCLSIFLRAQVLFNGWTVLDDLTILVISVISTFHHTTIAQSFFYYYLFIFCVCVFTGEKLKRNQQGVSEMMSEMKGLQSTFQEYLPMLNDHTKASCEQNITWTKSVNTMATETKVTIRHF